jgi:hypothetical protein
MGRDLHAGPGIFAVSSRRRRFSGLSRSQLPST